MRTTIRHIGFAVATILGAVLTLSGCMQLDAERQYEASLHKLVVTATYPEAMKSAAREGVTVMAMDDNMGRSYTALTTNADTSAGTVTAEFRLSEGLYNISMTDTQGRYTINGSADQVRLTGDVALSLPLVGSVASPIIIKEVYCGGCKKYPQEGTYNCDKYIILHNNDSETYYLDGLCFGIMEPYNAEASNVWISRDKTTGETIYPDFLPIGECIWQFGGSGTDFPLARGEDAVVAINGAIDHTLQYPNSVNLNKADYFVCYAPVYYSNTMYHPAPGDQISPKRYLNLVVKLGPANAYPMSQTSPGVVIFRAKDCTIEDFVKGDGVVVEKPGSSTIKVAKIPVGWALDAVEVFNGSSSQNKKRFPPLLDAGYVYQTESLAGHSLIRRYDEQSSADEGFAIYVDTNNSTNDFYESDHASLKDQQ